MGIIIYEDQIINDFSFQQRTNDFNDIVDHAELGPYKETFKYS